ncbi:GFA family protein [Reyranella sp.]|uniref:GFA family protein n=1 Tax=Reyranella sp. TaxID=1929291 RepID=UPI0040350281
MLKGGCFCGTVRYEAGGEPWHETMCHCSICRRTTGAPVVAWFTVRTGDFRIVSGQPSRFRSSPTATRTFCGACGTALTFHADDHRDEIDVTTGSLDDPERLPPRSHTWQASGLSWAASEDGLPAYAEKRPD